MLCSVGRAACKAGGGAQTVLGKGLVGKQAETMATQHKKNSRTSFCGSQMDCAVPSPDLWLKGKNVAAASTVALVCSRSRVSVEHESRRKHCTHANLKSGDNVKVLLHVGAKNLVDGTGTPHADSLWW